MKNKRKKYNKGGQLASAGASALSLIPGIGGVLSGIASTVVGLEQQQNAMADQVKRNLNNVSKVSNPYQFENGGMLQGSEDAAMYNGNSHAAGGIGVNNNGIPDPNTSLEVEGEEFKIDLPNQKTYVFSKKLKV